jgi:hypothetical protein
VVVWQITGPGAGEREIFDDVGVVEEFFLFKDLEVMVFDLVSLAVIVIPMSIILFDLLIAYVEDISLNFF